MECGVEFGNVSRWNPHNQKGNNENLRIMRLHDDVLQSNNGAWYDPPSLVRWSQEHRRLRDAIVKEYSLAGHTVWGFKDPRTLFTLDGWLESLGTLTAVGIFRHPACVIESLNRRDPGLFTIQSAAQLWYRYNRRLLRYASELDMRVIQFDDDDKRFLASLSQLIDSLDLPQPPRGFRFFESRLQHFKPRQQLRLPTHVKSLFCELCEFSLDGRKKPHSKVA
jgi:hypothetical protein